MHAPKRPKFLYNIEQLDDASLSSDLIIPANNEKNSGSKLIGKTVPAVNSKDSDRSDTNANNCKSEHQRYSCTYASTANNKNAMEASDQPLFNFSSKKRKVENNLGHTSSYQQPKFLNDINMLDDATLSSDYIPVEPAKQTTVHQFPNVGSSYPFPIHMPLYFPYGQFVPYILNNGFTILTNSAIFPYPQQQSVAMESHNQTPIDGDSLTICGDQLSIIDNIAEDKSIEYAFTGQQQLATSSSSAPYSNEHGHADNTDVDVANVRNKDVVQDIPQSQLNLYPVPSHLPLMHLPKRLEAVLNATNFDLFNTLIKHFFVPDCIFRTTVMERDETGIDAIMKCYSAVFQAYPDGVFKIRKVQFDRTKRLISVCVDFDGTKRTVSENDYMINYVTHGSTANVNSNSEPQPLTHRPSSSTAQSELLVDPMLRNRALNLLRLGAQYRVKHRSTWHWVLTRPEKESGSSSQQTNQNEHEMMKGIYRLDLATNPMPSSNLIKFVGNELLKEPPRKVVLSGPSGFLGSRVVQSLLKVHKLRKDNGLNPGELVILSARPGRLMEKLVKEHGNNIMATVRAARVDYYTQHDMETWIDNLGSLGLEGDHCVFVNLAAVAGPDGEKGGLELVNYKAPIAAAQACQYLGFGHWIQSSTQATVAERASQVKYSRGKAMTDYHLSRMDSLPVTIASLGLLYCRTDGLVGQDGRKGLNLIDLALLPLTPIMGSGNAPLQPLEVTDASDRLAYLALTDPAKRPIQRPRTKGISVEYGVTVASSNMLEAQTQQQITKSNFEAQSLSLDTTSVGSRKSPPSTFRKYDAVGPEIVSMTELLQRFAAYQGRRVFRPVYIGYNTMEEILNITSFGNMNRQFLSLLRSEQQSHAPATGDPRVWSGLLGPQASLITLDQAFDQRYEEQARAAPRTFPYWTTLKLVLNNPRVILPGIRLSIEILASYFAGSRSQSSISSSKRFGNRVRDLNLSAPVHVNVNDSKNNIGEFALDIASASRASGLMEAKLNSVDDNGDSKIELSVFTATQSMPTAGRMKQQSASGV